ncbi:hypothetical protein O181_064115 [Austropuccinia psidii MF-1]|uniref:Uncharacterized protein n=1 Tax=Austropuccinia psidii MF-1 TaxID=1389203 RepID=A0A9Q3EJY4_9BASI|nr:hypothetical protein [Austropuccinia psidii MF-1]
MNDHLRKSLFWRTWECQDWFNLQDIEIKNGKITNISISHIVKNAIWDFYWEETIIPAIFSPKGGATKLNTEGWDSFCQEHLFENFKREEGRGGKIIKQELVNKILGQRH